MYIQKIKPFIHVQQIAATTIFAITLLKQSAAVRAEMRSREEMNPDKASIYK